MTRRGHKQLHQLATLEDELRAALIPELRACAVGGTSLFLPRALRPASWPRNLSTDVADALFAAAEDIVASRASLGLDPTACLAARYLDACAQAVASDAPHRLGPRRMAAALLEEATLPAPPAATD